MKNILDNITAADLVLAQQINDTTREEAAWASAQFEKDLATCEASHNIELRIQLDRERRLGMIPYLIAVGAICPVVIKAIVLARREAINNTERVFRGRRFQLVKCPEGAAIADVMTAWDFLEKYEACIHPNDWHKDVSSASMVVHYPGLVVEVDVTLVGNKDFRFMEKR